MIHQLALAATYLALLALVGTLVAPLVGFNGRRDEEE